VVCPGLGEALLVGGIVVCPGLGEALLVGGIVVCPGLGEALLVGAGPGFGVVKAFAAVMPPSARATATAPTAIAAARFEIRIQLAPQP